MGSWEEGAKVQIVPGGLSNGGSPIIFFQLHGQPTTTDGISQVTLPYRPIPCTSQVAGWQVNNMVLLQLIDKA